MHVARAVLNNFTNKNMPAQENSMIHAPTKTDESEREREDEACAVRACSSAGCDDTCVILHPHLLFLGGAKLSYLGTKNNLI